MRSFKKIAAMIMAVAMLCSFTALGASVDIGGITLDGNVATIPYTATDADEVTALVYSGTTLGGANLVYIDQFEDGYPIPGIDLDDYGTYTVVMGGTGVATADTALITYEDTREYYTVTIADTANGYVKADKDLSQPLLAGTVVNLTFAPYIGYELTSFTIGGEDKVGAVENGVYSFAYTVEANAEIVATFTAIAADSVAGDAYIAGGIYDVAGADGWSGTENKNDDPSKLAFGKAVEVPGKTVKYMGMKVEVLENGVWVDFTTPKGAGPLFRATNPINNVYGIRFFGFSAGTYKVTSYVQYEANGVIEEPVLGDSVEFTVG